VLLITKRRKATDPERTMILKPNFTLNRNRNGAYTFIKDENGTVVASVHHDLAVSVRRSDGLLWDTGRDFRLTWQEQAAQALIAYGFESPWELSE
jgi:hypothetical protein